MGLLPRDIAGRVHHHQIAPTQKGRREEREGGGAHARRAEGRKGSHRHSR
ncbi:hypothetical protein SAQ01S_22910 [Sphingomonas aquatilis NBRC 16722]|nr:hypothetical protein SAQ01S_22910 [Sphingomonas aquatilis NBRC 16722]